MSSLEELLSTGLAHHQAGRLREAETAYRQMLAAEPGQPDALHLLGLLAHQAGQQTDAMELIRQALAARPDDAVMWNNLGTVLQSLVRYDEAAAAHHKAVELRPGYAQAYWNLGNALQRLERIGDAEAAFRAAVQFRPDYREALNNLGQVLLRQDRDAEAIDCYRRMLAIDANDGLACANLSWLYRRAGQVDEAERCGRLAVQLRPDLAAAHNNLGVALGAQEKIDEAVGCLRRAVELQPDYFDAQWNLARGLRDQGRADEARAAYGQACRLAPAPLVRFEAAAVLPVVYDSVEHIRQERQRLIDALEQLDREGVRLDPRCDVIQPLFHLAYQGENDREPMRLFGRLVQCSTQLVPGAAARRGGDGRIRVGFVSAYFRNHTVGDMWRGNLVNLDRRKFDVAVFSLAPADDAIGRFIRQGVERYVVLPPGLEAAQQCIRDFAPHVLVYPDLGMERDAYRFACFRLAPVQCASWGHADTTGLVTIDYYLSSELLETSQADGHYTERLVRARTLGLYLERAELPAPRKSRRDFGFPENGRLYGCMQSLFKLHPDNDALWAGILRRDREGRIVVPCGESAEWDAALVRRWRRTMPDVAGRVQFVSRRTYFDFLQLMAVMDVLLDPRHFGGGKTSWDALSLGLPVVTWPSDYLRGRMCAAMYRTLGMADAVTHDAGQYVETAVRLANDREFRTGVSRRILAAGNRLFQDAQAVEELETFLSRVAAPPYVLPQVPP